VVTFYCQRTRANLRRVGRTNRRFFLRSEPRGGKDSKETYWRKRNCLDFDPILVFIIVRYIYANDTFKSTALIFCHHLRVSPCAEEWLAIRYRTSCSRDSRLMGSRGQFRLLILLTLIVMFFISQPGLGQVWKTVLLRADSLMAVNQRDTAMLYLEGVATEMGALGRYAEEEIIRERIIVVMRDSLQGDEFDMAPYLNSLAIVCERQGKYVQAESLFVAAGTILSKNPFGNVFLYGGVISNLAMVYDALGEYGKAESILDEAISLIRGIRLDMVLELANKFKDGVSLDKLFETRGTYESAESFIREAIDSARVLFPPGDDRIAFCLGGLATILRNQNRYEEALPVFQEILDIKIRLWGPNDYEVGKVRGNLGYVYTNLDSLPQALTQFDSALVNQQNYFGFWSPDVSQTLEWASTALHKSGRLEEAFDAAQWAFRIRQFLLRENGFFLPERNALLIAQDLHSSLNNCLSSYSDAVKANPSLKASAAGVIVQAKGSVTDIMLEREHIFASESDSAISALVDSLRSYKMKIDYLTSSPDPSENGGMNRNQLQGATDKLEEELARRNSGYRSARDLDTAVAMRIQEKLPENTVLIEFLKYSYCSSNSSLPNVPKYVAAVLWPGTNQRTEVIELGDARPIDVAIDSLGKLLSSIYRDERTPNFDDRRYYANTSNALYHLMWKRIETNLHDGQPIIIAPDGNMNLLSFATLLDDSGKYLIERHPVQYVSSGKSLLRELPLSRAAAGFVAFGNPDFKASPQERLNAYHNVEKRNHQRDMSLAQSARSDPRVTVSTSDTVGKPAPRIGGTRGLNHRSLYIDSLLTKLDSLDYLPDTEREINSVAVGWAAQNPGSTTDIYLSQEASEDVFLEEAPRKKVIYIATHGYFLQGPRDSLSKSGGIHRKSLEIENPLLRSGILLSGASYHVRGGTDAIVNDGVVSAQEVSGMQLWGTSVVILSACETARGNIETGEGVYGLRHAFEIAGAGTVVAALWKIPSGQTADLMGKLFRGNPTSYARQLQLLQIQQIEQLRRNGNDHPYSWGAFIAIGTDDVK
jgi:CHAT domain-containing protein